MNNLLGLADVNRSTQGFHRDIFPQWWWIQGPSDKCPVCGAFKTANRIPMEKKGH
ncbi:hypothetical protein B0H19DRAFT_1153582 [Mycena capillaripes]|nr:hypothetical protein B0H19DRAFT_1153582 [Mycena capillaripes]